MTDESHGGNLAVPGPADREHFFAAQARNRRATWRLTALAMLGVLLMGIPMSVVISPLVYAALFLLNDVVNLLVPTPNLLYLAAHLDQNPAWTALPELTRNALVFGALVVPGSLVMLVAWLGARALFLTAGPESILRALGAREPRSGDLEEQQLRNLVAEMAIAGGVKPPRVLLLDGTAANAAAVGSSPGDATIVVSRQDWRASALRQPKWASRPPESELPGEPASGQRPRRPLTAGSGSRPGRSSGSSRSRIPD